jgi:cell division protein FtsQ
LSWRTVRHGATGLLIALAGLSLLQWPGRTVALAKLDGLAADAGLEITQVSVTGLGRALPADVFAALEGVPGRSILGFDSGAAKVALEALPWVKSATIARALPGELTIRIDERQPFAVWQNRQLPFLIDEEGRTLEPVAPSDHPELPVVAGAGAAEDARTILALLARYPGLRSRVAAAVRVGGRRWTLNLRNGPDILLSADDPAGSIERLVALEKAHKILARRVTAIDLRQPRQLVLRTAAASG